MAGFMAGFGNAFSDSFQKAAVRRADKEQDIFRYTFQAALDRRKEREASDKTKAGYVKQAKQLVELEGIDPRLLPDVYAALDSGVDASYVVKKFKGATYREDTPEAKTPEAAGDISADPTKAAAEVNPNDQVTPADEQTVAATSGGSPLPESVGGTVPEATAPEAAAATAQAEVPAVEAPTTNAVPAPVQPQAPAPVVPAAPQAQSEAESMVPPNVRKQVESALGEKMDLSPVEDKPVMQSTGHFVPGPADVDWKSPEETQYMFDTAKTPAAKAEWGAKLKAIQERVDAEALAKNPQGQGLVMFRDKNGLYRTQATRRDESGKQVMADGSGPMPADARPITDDEYKVRQEIAKGTENGTKILGKQAKIVSLYPDANALIQEAYAQPAVLNSVGSISSWIASADANIQSVQQIIATSAPESAEVENGLAKVNSMLAKTPIADVAQRTSLFRSKILLMGYRAGDIEGQKGQSLNEKDFSRLQQVLSGADANPATFAKLMKNYMADLTANADIEIKSYNDSNGLAQEYEQNFCPTEGGCAPGTAFIKPMEAMIMGSDDQTKQAYMDLQKAGEAKVNLPEERHAPVDTSKIPPEAINDLKANPNSAAAFDEWFGEGASDAVLGKKKVEGNGGSNPK